MDSNKYYELHVTVQPDDVLGFTSFCQEIKAKPLYIQLSQGEYQDQLMLAQTHMLQNDFEATAWARDFGDMVQEHFPVARVKLESRLTEGRTSTTRRTGSWISDTKGNTGPASLMISF